MLRKYYWHSWFTMVLALAVSTAWADENHAPKKADCCDKACCEKGCCQNECCKAGDAKSSSCCQTGCCSKDSQTAEVMLPGPCCPYCERYLEWLEGLSYPQDSRMVTKVYPVMDLAVLYSTPKPSGPGSSGIQTASFQAAQAHVDAQKLIDVIVHTVDPQSWDSCGGSATVEFYPLGGALVICQSEDAHARIDQLLCTLRECVDLCQARPNPVPTRHAAVMTAPQLPVPSPMFLPPVAALPPCPANYAVPCPVQQVCLPVPSRAAQMSDQEKAQTYKLQMSFVSVGENGARHVQVQPVCWVPEGQDAVMQVATQTPRGLEIRHVEYLLHPCAEGRPCLNLTVETGIHSADDKEQLVREHRVSLQREVTPGDGVHRIALDADDEGKAQSWLEFTVQKVESEQLPPPRPCVAATVAQCPAATTAASVPLASAAPGTLPCAATVSAGECEHEWVFQTASEGADCCLSVSKDESQITCKELQLKMTDGNSIHVSSSDDGLVLVGSQSLHAQAACVRIPATMDKVMFEGKLQLTHGKNMIEVPEGKAVWNLKDGTLDCHSAKISVK